MEDFPTAALLWTFVMLISLLPLLVFVLFSVLCLNDSYWYFKEHLIIDPP